MVNSRFLSAILALSTCATLAFAGDRDGGADSRSRADRLNVQVGVRPFYLVEGMDESALKDQLQAVRERTVPTSRFSIGHRGAPLEFPEHSRERL